MILLDLTQHNSQREQKVKFTLKTDEYHKKYRSWSLLNFYCKSLMLNCARNDVVEKVLFFSNFFMAMALLQNQIKLAFTLSCSVGLSGCARRRKSGVRLGSCITRQWGFFIICRSFRRSIGRRCVCEVGCGCSRAAVSLCLIDQLLTKHIYNDQF